MLASIEPEQFEEWRAMYQLEPWGDDWEQAGTVAAAVWNASGNTQEARSASEFIPSIDAQEPEGLSDDELREKHAQRYGGVK